jgi:hypothetical protein
MISLLPGIIGRERDESRNFGIRITSIILKYEMNLEFSFEQDSSEKGLGWLHAVMLTAIEAVQVQSVLISQ